MIHWLLWPSWAVCGFLSMKVIDWNFPKQLIQFWWPFKVLLVAGGPLSGLFSFVWTWETRERLFGIDDDGIFSSHHWDAGLTDHNFKIHQSHHSFMCRKNGPSWIDPDGHEEYCAWKGGPIACVIEADGTVLTGREAMTYYYVRRGFHGEIDEDEGLDGWDIIDMENEVALGLEKFEEAPA